MVGNFLAPAIARRLREEQMLVGALGLSAVSGIIAAVLSGPAAGAFLAAMLNLAGAVGRLAFESIVQRDAPEANRGRAFAQFETHFQFAWAVAGLIPVIVVIPGAIGFLVVGLVSAAALVNYVMGSRSMGAPPIRARRRSRLRRPVRRPAGLPPPLSRPPS